MYGKGRSCDVADVPLYMFSQQLHCLQLPRRRSDQNSVGDLQISITHSKIMLGTQICLSNVVKWPYNDRQELQGGLEITDPFVLGLLNVTCRSLKCLWPQVKVHQGVKESNIRILSGKIPEYAVFDDINIVYERRSCASSPRSQGPYSRGSL